VKVLQFPSLGIEEDGALELGADSECIQ
jgi:hypothetical protein